MSRQPAVSGSFYPGSDEALRQTVDAMLSGAVEANSIGAVSPHAGYIYSGKTAAKAIAALARQQTYIIIGPNHHGRGAALAVSIERKLNIAASANKTVFVILSPFIARKH